MGAELLPRGVWERARKHGSWRTRGFWSLLYSDTAQLRLADCWQLHDIFAVTRLESEASDKFLVWMSLCDRQWQIHFFGYYKFVARPMVGGFGVSLGVVLSRWLAFLVLLFHHPRKGGENDTCLVCYGDSFFFWDAGAWCRLVSFSVCSVKTVCWQEAEKDPAFPVADTEFHVSWVSVTRA